MKYYRVKVKLKNGFEYSYTCIERMLAGMKKSSESYWTESITSEEINQEDFLKTREVTFEEDKVLRKAVVKSAKVVDTGKLVEKKKTPKMASLEDFFGEDDEPERHSIPTKETSRNKKTDTVKKVRARRST